MKNDARKKNDHIFPYPCIQPLRHVLAYADSQSTALLDSNGDSREKLGAPIAGYTPKPESETAPERFAPRRISTIRGGLPAPGPPSAGARGRGDAGRAGKCGACAGRHSVRAEPTVAKRTCGQRGVGGGAPPKPLADSDAVTGSRSAGLRKGGGHGRYYLDYLY
jgi:hypothetical protein